MAALVVGLGTGSAEAAPFVYVTNRVSASVSQFDVLAGGTLAPLSPAVVAAGSRPGRDGDQPRRNEPLRRQRGQPRRLPVRHRPRRGALAQGAGQGGRDLVALRDRGEPGWVERLRHRPRRSRHRLPVRRGRRWALSPKSPATVPAGDLPLGVAVSPNGESVYVTNQIGDDVSQYDVGAGGRLVAEEPGDGGGRRPPDRRRRHAGRQDRLRRQRLQRHVSQYDVGAGGRLSPKSPATVSAGGLPSEVAVSPDGRSVYVSDDAAAAVSQYDVDAGGRLVPKSPSAEAVGSDPFGVAVSPDGRSVYVANFGTPFSTPFTSGSVSQFDVAADGALSPKSPATVLAGAGSRDVVVSPPARVPSTKAQCKDGGWRAFPQFKNQGGLRELRRDQGQEAAGGLDGSAEGARRCGARLERPRPRSPCSAHGRRPAGPGSARGRPPDAPGRLPVRDLRARPGRRDAASSRSSTTSSRRGRARSSRPRRGPTPRAARARAARSPPTAPPSTAGRSCRGCSPTSRVRDLGHGGARDAAERAGAARTRRRPLDRAPRRRARGRAGGRGDRRRHGPQHGGVDEPGGRRRGGRRRAALVPALLAERPRAHGQPGRPGGGGRLHGDRRHARHALHAVAPEGPDRRLPALPARRGPRELHVGPGLPLAPAPRRRRTTPPRPSGSGRRSSRTRR